MCVCEYLIRDDADRKKYYEQLMQMQKDILSSQKLNPGSSSKEVMYKYNKLLVVKFCVIYIVSNCSIKVRVTRDMIFVPRPYCCSGEPLTIVYYLLISY